MGPSEIPPVVPAPKTREGGERDRRDAERARKKGRGEGEGRERTDPEPEKERERERDRERRERERERAKAAARHPASKPSCSEGHAAREERDPPHSPGRSTKGKKRGQKQWPPRLSGFAPKHPAHLEKLALCLGNPDKTLAKKTAKLNDRNIFQKQKCTTCLYKYTGRQKTKI